MQARATNHHGGGGDAANADGGDGRGGRGRGAAIQTSSVPPVDNWPRPKT